MGILRATKYKTFLKLSAAVFLLSTFIIPVVSLGKHVSAATDLTLTWKDAQTITVSGTLNGNLAGSVATSGQLPFSGSVVATPSDLCNKLFVTVDPSNNTAVVQSVKDGGVIASGTKPCYAETLGVTGPLPVGGTRPSTAAETADQQKAIITLHSNLNKDKSPSTVKFTLKDSSGKLLSTHDVPKTVVPLTNGSLGTGSDGTNYSVDYNYTFTLVPGTYSICFSKFENCKTFTKVKYDQLSINYGTYGSFNYIGVSVHMDVYTTTGSPFTISGQTIQLKQGSNVVETQKTPVYNHAPTSSDIAGSGSVSLTNISFATVTFSNVSPGNYQVCLVSNNSCVNIAKIADQATSPNPIVLNGNPSDVQGVKALYDCVSSANASTASCAAATTTPVSEIACTRTITNPLTWIVCPLVSAASDAVNVFDGQITCLMQIDLTDIFGTGSNANNPNSTACGTASNTITNSNGSTSAPSDAYYTAWNTFRSFALALMVIAGLVMVVSQAAGFELLDAYTIRKVLPRLLIAGVAITLSWQIMQFLVQITNAIGFGIRDIIYAPFSGFSGVTIGGLGSTFVGALLTGGAFLSLGLAGLGLFALTALLGVVVAFVTLILRKMIIIFLLMMAPFAIASFILPNTQKIWKLWWSTLSKALLMFPIIAGMIAVGHVFAATTWNSSSSFTNQIIAFIAYFLPYFMIPTAVRMAGGAVGSIGGMISKASQGGFAGLSKLRKQQVAKNMALAKSGQRFAGGTKTNTRGKFNTALQYASNIGHAGADPTKWKDRMGATLARASGQQRNMMLKDEDYDWAKDDGLNKAALESNSDDQLKAKLLGITGRYTGEGDPNLRRDIERVKHMRAKYSPEAFKQATYINAMAGGTAFTGVADVYQALAKVAGNDNGLMSTLIGISRSSLMSAGRVDQGGGGFNDTYKVVASLRKDNSYTLEQADRDISKSVIENQGAAVIAHSSMKPRSVKNLMPEYRLQLSEAIADKNKAVAENRTDDIPKLDAVITKKLAIIANLYDHASNSSPLTAGHIKDQLLDWDPTSLPEQSKEAAEETKKAGEPAKSVYNGANSVKSLMESKRNDPVFLAYRRELNAQEDRLRQSGDTSGGSGSTGTAGGNPTTLGGI